MLSARSYIAGYFSAIAISTLGAAHGHLPRPLKQTMTLNARLHAIRADISHTRYVASQGHGKPQRNHAKASRWLEAELNQAHLELANTDFETALRLAAHVYQVDYTHLHSCAATEGGFRGFIMNHTGSGAGGWMQFFPSTLYSNIDAAFTYAASRGLHGLGSYRSWYSRVGQAFTAAHMFRTGQSHQWTGAGC